jgi:predicted DNA-binding transcriptional regulator AlpA
MSHVRHGEVPELIDENEVSRITTIKLSTLRAWRCQRRILPFVKLGGKVRYVKSEVLEYIAQHRCEPSGRAGSRTKDDTW